MVNYQKQINPTHSLLILLGLSAVAGFLFYVSHKTQAVDENMTQKQITEKSQIFKGAVIRTNRGSIQIQFVANKATTTIKNFIKLADSGFYSNTKFHRVISNFMIQGGDPNTKSANISSYGTGGPGYVFADEINDEKMVRGVVAMANSGPNTNGSQFFIITAGGTPWLQGKHTVFAKVVQGIDIVDAISNVKTSANDLPAVDITVLGVDLD